MKLKFILFCLLIAISTPSMASVTGDQDDLESFWVCRTFLLHSSKYLLDQDKENIALAYTKIRDHIVRTYSKNDADKIIFDGFYFGSKRTKKVGVSDKEFTDVCRERMDLIIKRY